MTKGKMPAALKRYWANERGGKKMARRRKRGGSRRKGGRRARRFGRKLGSYMPKSFNFAQTAVGVDAANRFGLFAAAEQLAAFNLSGALTSLVGGFTGTNGLKNILITGGATAARKAVRHFTGPGTMGRVGRFTIYAY